MFRFHFMDNFVNTRKNFPDAQKLSGRHCRRADEVFGTLTNSDKYSVLLWAVLSLQELLFYS